MIRTTPSEEGACANRFVALTDSTNAAASNPFDFVKLIAFPFIASRVQSAAKAFLISLIGKVILWLLIRFTSPCEHGALNRQQSNLTSGADGLAVGTRHSRHDDAFECIVTTDLVHLSRLDAKLE